VFDVNTLHQIFCFCALFIRS